MFAHYVVVRRGGIVVHTITICGQAAKIADFHEYSEKSKRDVFIGGLTMNEIGIFVFWLIGVIVALSLICVAARGVLEMYIKLREDVLYVLKMETLVLKYKKYQQEIDEYLEHREKLKGKPYTGFTAEKAGIPAEDLQWDEADCCYYKKGGDV